MRENVLRAYAVAAMIGMVVGAASPAAPTSTVATQPSRPRGSEFPARAGEDRDHGPLPARSRKNRAGHLLVRVDRDLPVRARPGAGRVLGVVPSGSRFYGQPIVAWVEELSREGRFGRVTVPYTPERRTGWIRLRGLERSRTFVRVRVDLSRRWVIVERNGRALFGVPGGIGSPSSPTPVGRYFVTDRVQFPGGGSFGTFAFGISGVQPDLPSWWDGGDQLAIHGTDATWSIGRAASAGCVRVTERALDRLSPLLHAGTPVVITK